MRVVPVVTSVVIMVPLHTWMGMLELWIVKGNGKLVCPAVLRTSSLLQAVQITVAFLDLNWMWLHALGAFSGIQTRGVLLLFQGFQGVLQ